MLMLTLTLTTTTTNPRRRHRPLSRTAGALAASAAVAAAAAAVPALAASANSGAFTCVSFNVAGLPAFLQSNGVPGDKATVTTEVGRRLSAYNYDVINVQEDFNYHANLYSQNTHPYRTATSGGVPFGSGLNTLSNYPFVDDDRIKWNKCNGVLNDSNDCLTPKGFTFMRINFDEGIYVGFYNLHADAGDSDADEDARRSNIQQVIDHIKTVSAGDPVIVFGDTNSRYTRIKDNIQQFRFQAGMTDAWPTLIHGSEPVPGADAILCSNPSSVQDCEVVDKLFYRSNGMVQLTATHFEYVGNKFLQADGSIMSDHDPILVNMTWSLKNGFRQSQQWGGPHGDFYQDMPLISVPAKAAKIVFRGADRVDSVGLVLSTGQILLHGGSGGTESSLVLAPNEYWVGTDICQAQYNGHTRVFFIKATTSAGRTVQAGKQSGDCVSYSAPSGYQVVGFFGRSGDEVDKVGLIYLPQIAPTLNANGWFRLGSSSDPAKCLDFPGGAAAGTSMEIWDCNAGGVQQFTYVAGQLVNKATGWCLDLRNDARQDGAVVGLWPCNGQTAQQWLLEDVAGHTRVKLAGTNFCVNDFGGKLANGSPVGLWTCRDDDAPSKWIAQNEAALYGRFSLATAVNSSFCLDFQLGGPAGAPTALWSCGGGPNQSFTYRNGQIISEHNQMCLDVDQGKYSDRAKVQMYPCNGGDNQQWVFKADPTTGATQIRAKANQNFCLNDYQFGASNGAAVVLFSCFNDTASSWKLNAA
ncbi:Endonuclease/exonuclease/phosphatase [Zopfochytrium polystomum]|nr:Endonuclease/exonuclease/phosphatase [Zopfochytrium polystomum]